MPTIEILPPQFIVEKLGPSSIQALKANGMYHCWGSGDGCELDPVCRLSEVELSENKIITDLTYLCAKHLIEIMFLWIRYT